MRDFLRSEAFYLKKDGMAKGICLLFAVASVGLVAYIGAKFGLHMDNLADPIATISQVSLFFYFIIPIQVCFFSTEGFEYGTVKNIIACGKSREAYVIGKYLTELTLIGFFLVQFFGLYYCLHLLGAVVTGANIGNSGLSESLFKAFSTLGFNFLYLVAYAAIILMAGLLIRKTATVVIITFGIVFGDFMISGYLKGSASPILSWISEHTLTTHIMKFSGVYVLNKEKIMFSSATDYIIAIIVPLCIIAVCITVSLISFRKRDIHA